MFGVRHFFKKDKDFPFFLHELGNVLTSINMYAYILDKKAETKPFATLEEEILFSEMLERIDGASRLVESFRSLSSLPPYRPSEVENIGNFFEHWLKAEKLKNPFVCFQFDNIVPRRCRRLLDLQSLRLLFINALNNALNSLNKRRHLDPHFDKPVITVSLRLDEQNFFHMSVADNGMGLLSKAAAVSAAEKGLYPQHGLGLEIARRVAHAHGGFIALGSNTAGKDGQGAVFSLCIPEKPPGFIEKIALSSRGPRRTRALS